MRKPLPARLRPALRSGHGLFDFFGHGFRQIRHHGLRHPGKPLLLRAGQHAAIAVVLGLKQRGNGGALVVVGQILLLQRLLGAEGRLYGIPRQQPLVELRQRGQQRLIAKQDVEKLELRDMAAEHHEAHRQRRR